MAQRALRDAARLVASGQAAAQRAALFAAPGDASFTAAMGDASLTTGDGTLRAGSEEGGGGLGERGGGVDSSGAGGTSGAGVKQVMTPVEQVREAGKKKAGELSEKKSVYRWRQVPPWSRDESKS